MIYSHKKTESKASGVNKEPEIDPYPLLSPAYTIIRQLWLAGFVEFY